MASTVFSARFALLPRALQAAVEMSPDSKTLRDQSSQAHCLQHWSELVTASTWMAGTQGKVLGEKLVYAALLGACAHLKTSFFITLVLPCAASEQRLCPLSPPSQLFLCL